MSLFASFEKDADVYQATDSNTTKISTYPTTKTFTVKVFIINRSAEGSMLMGDEIGDYICNIRNDQTNASNIKKGDKMVVDSKVYFVKNTPKFINMFNKYKLLLAQE